MPEFYSTQDVADRLGVSIFTIRRYIQSGKLDAVKLDGGYRVSRTALDHFLAERATGAPAPTDRTATERSPAVPDPTPAPRAAVPAE